MFKSENKEKNVPEFVPKRVCRRKKGFFLSQTPIRRYRYAQGARKTRKKPASVRTGANALCAREQNAPCTSRKSVLR
jgi:hypothetical protein